MNDIHRLTAENMLQTLPDVLRNDQSTRALAVALAEALSHRIEEIQQLKLYTRIEELPEELLDILACDFKVDWWNGDYTLYEKRRTLLDSWHAHRTLGTKYAVETALSAVYPGAFIEEWWEYQGNPHHFRICVGRTGQPIHPKDLSELWRAVSTVKRLSSWLDEIITTTDFKPAQLTVAGWLGKGYMETPLPEIAPDYHMSEIPLHAGGVFGTTTATVVPQLN